jgi:hypothetical protein
MCQQYPIEPVDKDRQFMTVVKVPWHGPEYLGNKEEVAA